MVPMIDFITSEMRPFSIILRYAPTQHFVCKVFKRKDYIYTKATPENCCGCNSEDFGNYKCMRIDQACG